MILVASLSACASKSNDRFHTREGSFWDQLMGRTSYASLFDQRTKEARIHSDFEPVMIAFIT
ncbi:MAG: hypothetical protein JWQ35_179, partial [Bacteriovoracaceae bacterium]|nr:hypothetical protein [Bacteriovoracaceae bacterium]